MIAVTAVRANSRKVGDSEITEKRLTVAVTGLGVSRLSSDVRYV